MTSIDGTVLSVVLVSRCQLFRFWVSGGVVPAPVVQNDLNLSNGADLLDINLHVMKAAGHDNWIAETAEIAEGAELNSVVVMSGGRVAAGAVLEECLVMPGETAPAGKHRRKIFMRGHEISCV